MSDKPSYLGLLNAVSLAETEAHEYLTAWAAVTPHEGVKATLLTVAAREGEHGMSFAKRINELGYNLRPAADDPKRAERLAVAGSKQRSNRLGATRSSCLDCVVTTWRRLSRQHSFSSDMRRFARRRPT